MDGISQSESSDSMLREASAVASMIAHFKRAKDGSLMNTRRRRRSYSSYPTPPWIASAACQFVIHCWRATLGHVNKRPLLIDPSMEGGPFLLEFALALARKPWQGLQPHLLGVDQNAALAPFVRSLLTRARTSRPEAYSFSVRAADAFEVMDSHGSFEALINNPPWGAGIDGADGATLAKRGPFNGYREPLIAFVSVAVRKLSPGAPFALVIPTHILTSAAASGLREELQGNSNLDAICHLPTSAFPRLTMYTALVLGRRRLNGRRNKSVLVHFCGGQKLVPQSIVRAVPEAGPIPWLRLCTAEAEPRPYVPVVELRSLARVVTGIEPYHVGRGYPPQTPATVRRRPFSFTRPGRGRLPVVRGRNVTTFSVQGHSEYLKISPELAYLGNHVELSRRPRAFVRELCRRDGRLTAAVAPLGVLPRRGVFTIVCDGVEPEIVCALLNSSWAAHWVRTTCPGFRKESFGRIAAPDLRRFPVPIALTLETPASPNRKRLGVRISEFTTAPPSVKKQRWRFLDNAIARFYSR